jgi:hypothetical protein
MPPQRLSERWPDRLQNRLSLAGEQPAPSSRHPAASSEALPDRLQSRLSLAGGRNAQPPSDDGAAMLWLGM